MPHSTLETHVRSGIWGLVPQEYWSCKSSYMYPSHSRSHITILGTILTALCITDGAPPASVSGPKPSFSSAFMIKPHIEHIAPGDLKERWFWYIALGDRKERRFW